MFGNNGSRIASWLIGFLPMSRCHGLKCWLLRSLGGLEVGCGTCIWSGARFSGRYIKIGANCHFGEGTFVGAFSPEGQVTIGDNVTFGPSCFVSSGTHTLGPSSRRAGNGAHRAISIADGTEVCVRAVISAGTIIGRGCVIGPNVVASGVIKDNVMLMTSQPVKMPMPVGGM